MEFIVEMHVSDYPEGKVGIHIPMDRFFEPGATGEDLVNAVANTVRLHLEYAVMNTLTARGAGDLFRAPDE